MNIHFFTIVRNGLPFMRQHLDVFLSLGYNWHWHIVEGQADLKHDTAWSLASGGRIPEEVNKNTLSTDGTTEYIDELASNYPNRITVYRKPKGELWNGKLEMVRSPLAEIHEECLLWQIDVDEFWTADQIEAVSKAFTQDPSKTAAWYWCNFYVGPEAVVSTRNCYSQNPNQEWLRTWHFKPGDRWLAHEPPTLVRKLDNGREEDLGRINPFLHDETERLGAVFDHHAYVQETQLVFKEQYYGYKNALNCWKLLQKDLKTVQELPLGNYFSWVSDKTMVKSLGQFKVKKYQVVVDGVFFELAKYSGIARVWSEVLKRWGCSEFGSEVLLIDRAGTTPNIEGINKVYFPSWDLNRSGDESLRIDDLCQRVGAKTFISTYYSSSIETPSVMLVHDLIPEVLGADLQSDIWPEKDLCIRHASHLVCVSQNTKNDLVRIFGEEYKSKTSVSLLGVSDSFSPCSNDEISSFRSKYRLRKPYILFVGDRVGMFEYQGRKGYKNVHSAVKEIADWKKAEDHEIICIGGAAFLEENIVKATKGRIAIRRLNVDEQELRTAYSGAAAFVYPSLYEGFGLPVLEAMACGCPVIMPDRASLPEVGGDAVLYFNPFEGGGIISALEKLNNHDFKEELLNKGIRRARSFRWDILADHLQNVCEKDYSEQPNHPSWKLLRKSQKNMQMNLMQSSNAKLKSEMEILNRSKWIKFGQMLGICHKPDILGSI